ncbi:MAG: hypothetical protein QM759_02375 [Terricaulis sp.]
MRLAALGLFIGVLAAAGCVGAPKDQPAWVTQRLAGISNTYPNLHDVPRSNNANTDVRHWAEVQADVMAAGQTMRADPRNQPAPPQDPNAFIGDAQNAIDQARAAHGPN